MKPIICRHCGSIMDIIEDCDGASITYTWNATTKRYDEGEEDFYGTTTRRHSCSNCLTEEADGLSTN